MSYAGIFTDKNNADHPVTSTLYGTCDTAAATAAKVVTCADVDVLTSGMTIRVKFTNANTAASPTINVNSTGAKTVYRFGTTAPVDGDSWKAGEVVELLYDGTYFYMVSADDIGSKQDTLTFDDVPTDGSNNPVKSNGIYDALATKANTDMVAADFNAGTSYTAGNYCIYEGKFYKFKNNHSGAWSAADVDEIKIAGELSALKSGLTNLEEMIGVRILEITPDDTSTHYMYIDKPINKNYDALVLENICATTNSDHAMTTWVQGVNLTGEYADKSLIRYRAPIAGLTYKVMCVWFDVP